MVGSPVVELNVIVCHAVTVIIEQCHVVSEERRMVNGTDSDNTEVLPPPEHQCGPSIDGVPSHVGEFKGCKNGVPVFLAITILSVWPDHRRELVVPTKRGSKLDGVCEEVLSLQIAVIQYLHERDWYCRASRERALAERHSL